MAEPEDTDAGDTRELAVTKVVTLRDLELTPSPPTEEWVVKCFRVADCSQELSPMHEWELTDTSHVLMHIDIRNQQLYHLPLLITPIHCVYLVTFDLRNGKKALDTIRRTLKQISAFVSNDAESLLDNCLPSNVLLVGTHGEEISQEQRSEFVQELQSLKARYDDLIEEPDDSEFWSIEGDSIDIQSGALFEEIISHCSYPKVPMLQCMKYDKQLRQACRGKTIVKSKLPDVSRKDVKKFLAFLHDYGFIVYHPYRELQDDDTSVVLDPQYLCQLFARVQQLRKKKGQVVTVERLFSSNAKLERSMKKWFETFCIRMGLVIVQPSRNGKKLVFVLSRQLQSSEATSLAPHVYSVDPLLVAYNPQGMDGDSFVPPRFFPAFANTFLEILHGHPDCKDKLNVSINQSQAEIVIVWQVGCQIHVLEQESCIEIGFQINAVNWDKQDMQSRFQKLQERCQTVKAVVAQSAKRAVECLNLPGGDACVEYGFYHECNGDKVIGVHVSDRHETALRCYCSCRRIPCTPMQKIWFQDVTNCKVRLQRHEADGNILKLVEGTAPIQPSPQSQYTPGEKAQQVLNHFRSQFIDIVDANAIVHDLKHEGIIDGGDLTNITKTPGGREQNAILHECLLQKCTEEALMKVCKIIVDRDHPRMKELGEQMKSKLDEIGKEKEEEAEEKKESLDVLKFQEQYSEVVRNQASVTLKITKCTTIGPPRIGKTCLTNLLIGQEWDVEAGTASTDVMEAPEWVECYSLEDDGAEELWKLVSKEQQKGELIRAVNESTINRTQLTTPDSQHPTKPTDKTTPTDAVATASGTESRIIPASAHPPTSKRGTARKSATVQQALKALAVACSSEALQDFLKDKQGKVLGKRRLIHFIDTGGQSIYHDIHPILITSPSIYLVVFSLDDFQQKNDQARLSYFRSDLIQRPLRSIYTFGRKNPEEKNLLQLQPEAPKIFIVGTHLDRISLDGQEQFLERIDEMMEEEISSKPYHQFVQYDTEGRSFWAVDNTLAGKEQDEDTKEYISTLRLMVQDRSMEMSVQVPLPWMLLKMVMDGQGVRYCKYSQLLEEACSRGYVREGSPDADLDIMLRLFNALGLIYHKVPSGCKKEDSLVFIDLDCLYSATSDFLMAAMEEIECSQRGSEEGQIQAAATNDKTAAVRRDRSELPPMAKRRKSREAVSRDRPELPPRRKRQTAKEAVRSDSPELPPRMKRRTASEERQIVAATKDEMADSQGRSDVEKSPYQIYTHLTKPSMDLAGGKQQMESGLPKTQKLRLIPATQKILSGGVESMKVIQRISSSFNAFLSDMRTVLSSLERTVMNVGQDDTDIVLRNLKEIQKGVEEKNSLFNAANTLQSKYRILAQEMVWRLMNSVRKVLQSSTSEDKKPKLDGITKDFWGQCQMTRRPIEADDFNHLLLLLTELRIIAGLKQPDCYLIPAALPQLRDQIPVAGDIEPLLFTVISQDDLLYYLPSGLFCCLISELVTKLGWTVEPLGRTHVAFTHEDLTGVVHVVEHESFIEIKLESTMQVNLVCNSVREQIDKRINNVYDMIYDPPESRRPVVASLESRRAVVGFKCNCGRGPAHAPHFAAYEEDKFESCVRCLLQGSTDVHMHPLTQQQLVWYPRPAVAGMQ